MVPSLTPKSSPSTRNRLYEKAAVGRLLPPRSAQRKPANDPKRTLILIEGGGYPPGEAFGSHAMGAVGAPGAGVERKLIIRQALIVSRKRKRYE